MLDLDTRPRASLPAADVEAQQPAPRWALFLAPSTSMCALGALGFAYAAVLLAHAGVSGKERDLTLCVIGVLLLAPICVVAQSFLVRPDFRSPKSAFAETVNCWAAVTLLLALASIPIVMYVAGKGGEFWLQNAGRVIVAVAALHVAALAILRPRKQWLPVLEVLSSRAVQVAILVLAFLVAGIALFWVDPSNRHLNLFVRLFFAPPFSGEPGAFGLGPALMLAVFAVAAVAALGRLEAALILRGSKWLQAARTIALCVAVQATVLAFFDFSLANDVAHYLTNVGPALHLLHGGVLMVDTFSQYGPGPVLVTLLGLQIGPATFGTAQVTVQICNFAFYVMWLICLYRMTRWKLAGLLLGIFSIAFFLAAYIRGYGNINDAPSILVRHLPTLSMVLALSCLRPPQRHSVFTALATFVSGAWSVETLIGTLSVHLAFLGLLGLRDRMVLRLVVDGVRAVAPAVVATIVMMLAIVLRAGALPDYGTYLQYFSSYNPLATYWSFVASPMFFGWLAMLLAVFVVCADAWTRVFTRTARLTDMDETALFYRFVPMAALLMIQAGYFVGRSLDSSLGLAVLPFCAIAIPASLAVTAAVTVGRGPARLLASIIPVAIGLWALTFTFLSLFRQDSPYSLLLHECRDLGRCSPAALARGFNETIRQRGGLERVRRPITDGWFDANGIVRDAVSMMIKWAPNEPAVTVLLGRLRPELDVTATEFALMYAGKWNRWPRSFTPSDQLVMRLAQRIIASPVRLREGELVLVRRDETALGLIEAGILKRIRAEATLCQLRDPSREVIAYRVASSSGCPAR